MNKISAVYKIVNTITGDCYVGSSKNVYRRWVSHKQPSTWRKYPHNPLYLDMQKYGLDCFRFQILAPVMEEYLKQVEQEFIELLHSTYNDRRANGKDIERYKEAQRKGNRKYLQSDKGKEARRKERKRYNNRLCSYNGETLTLRALYLRFYRAGIEHPIAEARKYILQI